MLFLLKTPEFPLSVMIEYYFRIFHYRLFLLGKQQFLPYWDLYMLFKLSQYVPLTA